MPNQNQDLVHVICLDCGAESDVGKQRLARRAVCDAEVLDGDSPECGGTLMEHDPEEDDSETLEADDATVRGLHDARDNKPALSRTTSSL